MFCVRRYVNRGLALPEVFHMQIDSHHLSLGQKFAGIFPKRVIPVPPLGKSTHWCSCRVNLHGERGKHTPKPERAFWPISCPLGEHWLQLLSMDSVTPHLFMDVDSTCICWKYSEAYWNQKLVDAPLLGWELLLQRFACIWIYHNK